MGKIKNILTDTMEELNWWRGYAESLEDGIKEMRALINESSGIVGYHLNDEIAKWDELMTDSLFSFAEDNIQSRKDFTRDPYHVIRKARKELFIKEYKNMPITVQYTPVYGGIKYTKKDQKDRDETKEAK